MNKKGQSILEYTVMFVAVVAVIVVAIPLFIKPSVNKYYESSGVYFNTASDGIDRMTAGLSDKFTGTWDDYSFDMSLNEPFDIPSYAEMTAGWPEMQDRIGQFVPGSPPPGGLPGGGECGGPGQLACP